MWFSKIIEAGLIMPMRNGNCQTACTYDSQQHLRNSQTCFGSLGENSFESDVGLLACGFLMTSEIPKDMEPIKSLRVVRSQSQTAISNRRSLSSGFKSLNWKDAVQRCPSREVTLLGTVRQDENS